MSVLDGLLEQIERWPGVAVRPSGRLVVAGRTAGTVDRAAGTVHVLASPLLARRLVTCGPGVRRVPDGVELVVADAEDAAGQLRHLLQMQRNAGQLRDAGP